MSRARGRFLLFVTPVSAVAVVLLGVISGGVRPFRSARVYSGPTQGITDLRLRVELGDRDRIVEVPATGVPFTVVAWAFGQRLASATARSDELGSAEVSLSLPKPVDSALELVVEPVSHDQAPLARGLVLGSRSAFRALATRRGGFQRSTPRVGSSELTLAVAPSRGVLVTAQGALDDELTIAVSRDGRDARGARITVKLEGATPSETDLVGDERGRARLRIRATEPQVRVQLHAVSPNGGEGNLAARLEVVQGAIRATKRGDRLALESSGAASVAYVGFFDESQRYGGARAALTGTADGHLVGDLPWPSHLSASPLWVVTSSQPDLASPSAVGWPVVGAETEAPQTFDARELLLLDGAPAARVREERRARRIRWVTAGYAALALLLTCYLFVRRVREADVNFESHLTRSGVDEIPSIAPRRRGRAVLAAACIALGFVVLAVFALLKD
ncbi:MAG: hypothetical protein K0R38_1927 [Polyangiaceae bacterium]|jgi:hypothetical protein|nr:hypothetical protein [Polyangiaceae bacterium]